MAFNKALLSLVIIASVTLSALGVRMFSLTQSQLSLTTTEPIPSRLMLEADRATKMRAANDLAQLPLSFEPNQGHSNSTVKFTSRSNGINLSLSSTEAILTLGKTLLPKDKKNLSSDSKDRGLEETEAPPVTLKMRFIGARKNTRIVGSDELAGKGNYFIGNDSSKWSADIKRYGRVKYKGLFPGIDLDYYGNNNQLEYDFTVAPGAEVQSIKLAFDGAEKTSIDATRGLILQTRLGEIRHHKPFAYQEVSGDKREVYSRYTVSSNQEITFEVGAYDASKPLIIDPIMDYSTFLGGSENDQGIAIAVDSSGNTYLTGLALSPDFPLVNPLQSGTVGVFVTKMDSKSKALIYSTIIGSPSSASAGLDIAVDSAGNAYVCGYASQGFPTTPGAYSTIADDRSDVFALKLNPAGNQLVYSTFIGDDNDFNLTTAIAIDSQGNAYVTGESGLQFPTTPGAFQQVGGDDVFVAKLNATGSALIYSTFIGGNNTDAGFDIAVDEVGYAYVTGATRSANFPVVNALQPTFGGFLDAFIAKLNPDGSNLVFSTYLGGSGGQFSGDMGLAIALDGTHNVYVGGRTESPDFPTTPGAFQTAKVGRYNAFITKLNSEGNALLYSTYFGGGGESVNAMAVDEFGNCYIAGSAFSDLPLTPDALQNVPGGDLDAFVTKLNATGTGLIYSSYLGGSQFDEGIDIAVDTFGNAYVTGRTISVDFPTTRGAFQRKHSKHSNGLQDEDVFVTKLILGPPKIVSASVNGKKLFVMGGNFDEGAVILLNGEKQKTTNDDSTPTNRLIGKKAGKKIERGVPVILQVQNADGKLSSEFSFTRPD